MNKQRVNPAAAMALGIALALGAGVSTDAQAAASGTTIRDDDRGFDLGWLGLVGLIGLLGLKRRDNHTDTSHTASGTGSGSTGYPR